MITVGYGDIAPVTQNEYLLSILTMLSTCGVFAHALNQIGTIFQDMDKDKNELNEKMSIINKFMLKKRIPSSLQYQIRQYLEYNLQKDTYDSQKVNAIIDNLSLSLKEQILWGKK